jgi:hypothetical protein
MKKLAHVTKIIGFVFLGVGLLGLLLGLIRVFGGFSDVTSPLDKQRILPNRIAEGIYYMNFGVVFALPFLGVSWWASRRARKTEMRSSAAS